MGLIIEPTTVIILIELLLFNDCIRVQSNPESKQSGHVVYNVLSIIVRFS